MWNNKLLKTNILVSVILLVGFVLTAMFGYQANYQASLNNIEQVSSLTAEGIYYQLTTMFTKPVNISLTMAHDSLLREHLLNEEEQLEQEDYIQKTMDYLNGYRGKYGFDSVFLVSSASGRYYNFNGLDRVLKEGEAENKWYFELLDSDQEYSLNVDNDEVEGADNEITVFINCKIQENDGNVLGVIGVGIRMNHMKELLAEYEEKYNLEAYLVDADGTIEISTNYTGYENVDWFQEYGQKDIQKKVMEWKEDTANLELWTSAMYGKEGKCYVVTRYIPELKWHLIIEQDTGQIIEQIRQRVFQICCLIFVVILAVLVIVTTVIRHFNRQITDLMEERQTLFRQATEQLYDNIYELNITKNCCVGERTAQYFESLGAKGMPFDKGLQVIAQKQIKEEFRAGYISTFSPSNVKREFEKGTNHLRYDFMITQDGVNYFWMRIDARIFYSSEDESIHMFIYRKNIEEEKRTEQKVDLDEMTGFYTRMATERIINRQLLKNPERQYAFFMFDIDGFKQVNDQFGHAFGDYCIQIFTGIIKKHFRASDVLGRIGGDEFAVFVPVTDEKWVERKAAELSRALHVTCAQDSAFWEMSASIGVAMVQGEESEFETIYKNADKALYDTKNNGKNGFTIYSC